MTEKEITRIPRKEFKDVEEALRGFHQGLEEMLAVSLTDVNDIATLEAMIQEKSFLLGQMNAATHARLDAMEKMGADPEQIQRTKIVSNLTGIGYMAIGVAVFKKILALEKERDSAAAKREGPAAKSI